MMGLFISQKTISMKFFTDCCAQNFFFTRESVGKVFANGPGNQGSIPGQVIPKTQNMVLDTSLFNTQHYKVRIKGKVEKYRGRSSYWKGSLWVPLDYGHQLLIYIGVCVWVLNEVWYKMTQPMLTCPKSNQLTTSVTLKNYKKISFWC